MGCAEQIQRLPKVVTPVSIRKGRPRQKLWPCYVTSLGSTHGSEQWEQLVRGPKRGGTIQSEWFVCYTI